MPTIRIGGRDFEEVAVRQIRDPIQTTISSIALPTGAATEATLAQVRDAIKATIDLESTIWTDDSGAYYVRRDSVNEGTGAITISWTAPDGTAATPGAGLRPLSAAERDVTQDIYQATSGGTGYSNGDLIARLLVVDPNPSTPVITQIWYNLTTSAVIAAPNPAHLQAGSNSVAVSSSVLPTGAATSAKQDTLIGLIPSNLTVSSTRLLVDGSGVTQPTGVATRTPTTTRVVSSATSVTILSSNADRRGLSISNISTAKLYLSFSSPATVDNCFIEVPAGAFLLLDQQMMITNTIYGIWAAANGGAQVTEYV